MAICSATQKDSNPRFSASRAISPGLPLFSVRKTDTPIFITIPSFRFCGLAACAILRNLRHLRERLRRGHYCPYDLVIPRAATQVAGERETDLLLGGVRVLFQQCLGRH